MVKPPPALASAGCSPGSGRKTCPGRAPSLKTNHPRYISSGGLLLRTILEILFFFHSYVVITIHEIRIHFDFWALLILNSVIRIILLALLWLRKWEARANGERCSYSAGKSAPAGQTRSPSLVQGHHGPEGVTRPLCCVPVLQPLTNCLQVFKSLPAVVDCVCYLLNLVGGLELISR